MLRYVILGRRFDMYRIDRHIPEYDLAEGTTLCSAPSQKPLREFFLEPLCLGALDLMNLYQTVRWMRCSALSSLFTLTKGVASLTDELAKRLPVRLESPAARLVMEKDRVVGVQMEKDGSIQKASHVVMAVDPLSTAHLLPEVLEEQRAFFDSVIPIPYIMPVFFLDRPLDLGVWHYLNRPALRGKVMSATDQTAKTREMVPSGKTIITVGLGPDVDPDPAHLSDESLIKMAQDDMEPMIPGFPRYVEDATVIRYPYMEANYFPGSCRRVLDFVERAMQLKGVSFVSDVFGGSFIESAILSAEAAVQRIGTDPSPSR